MKLLRNIIRILIGSVFVFSGFVKSVDPLGTAYRIEDYFIAYGMQWAIPLSLFLSVLLCAFEFSLGILLLLNVKPRLISSLTLLIMAYFTVVTFFDAFYNLVPDCGCFGDAIKLSNWNTFYKNIVLIILVIILFFQRKSFKSPYSRVVGFILLVFIPLTLAWFSIYNYRNLPLIDFTAWKTGNKMIPENLQPARYYLVYQNKKTGETREFLTRDLPWQDTAWMSQWIFKSQRIDDPNQYPAPNFKILDTAGNDLTMSYLKQTGPLALIVCVDLDKSGESELKKVNDLYLKLNAAGYPVLGLTGSMADDVKKLNTKLGLSIQWYQSDDTELKTMVRSNPGLVLLKDAVVMKKWHIRNLPEAEELMKEYPK